MFLDRAGRTIFVEDAFRDARKYEDHWIDALFLWRFRIVHNFPAVAEEFTVKKFVHHPHLNDDVDQAKRFTKPVTNGIHFMSL